MSNAPAILLSGALTLLGAVVSIMNWLIVVKNVKTRRGISWIPLVGGCLMSAGVALAPREWGIDGRWWAPLLIDWGCVPGFVQTGVWFWLDRRRVGRSR